MAEQYKPAGSYELISFIITDFEDTSGQSGTDIKMLIHTWEIVESITSGSIRGSAKVYDSVGLLYDFPLRGQERILVTYKDWREVELTEEYILYSISNAKPFSGAADVGIEYTISFTSVGKFVSDKYDVRRCIANGTGSGRTYLPISDQVQVLFNDYYKENGQGTDKEIRITQTDGAQKVVIPSYRPEDAMHLFSRKSWSAEFRSQNFRFFETRKKYYFVNLEDLIVDPDDEYTTLYHYTTGIVDNTPDAEREKMQNILEYDFPSINNSHENLLEGAFYRKTNELNFLERIEIVNEYKHQEKYTDYEYPDFGSELGFLNTDEFIENRLDRYKIDYVIKDYPGPNESASARERPPTFYPDIYNNKNASVYHYGSSRLNVKIFGNNNLFPGMLIDIELPTQKAGNIVDTQRSGKYMIESIRNVFHEYMYYQTITLIKGGILKTEAVDTATTSETSISRPVIGPQ